MMRQVLEQSMDENGGGGQQNRVIPSDSVDIKAKLCYN